MATQTIDKILLFFLEWKNHFTLMVFVALEKMYPAQLQIPNV